MTEVVIIVDMIDINLILQSFIIGITGSGGIVALYQVWVSRQSKKEELELEKERLKVEQFKLENKIEQSKTKRLPLEHHPIFSTLDEIEYFFMRNFKLVDEGRTMIVREVCVSKLRVWRNIIKKYVNNSQSCYINCGSSNYNECNKTENEMAQMLLDGLNEYTGVWEDRRKILDVYGKVEYDEVSIKTMKVFLPIFREWHQSREEIVRMASHEIPNSGMNNDCYEDWWDVLSVYTYSFVQMKYDAVLAMRQLNGELTGKEFLGVIIGDDH